MLESVLAVPFWWEMVATITGAISGSLHAVKHDYDMFGVMCLACVTGLAGGITRDVLLQSYGIYAFENWELIVGCIIAALPVFYFGRLIEHFDLQMDIVDMFSVAMFAIIGAGKGWLAGHAVLPCAILGTISAVGGGCIRDLLLIREPKIFQSGTLYASATFIGALVFLVMRRFDLLYGFAPYIGVFVVIALRFVSVFFNIETHPARDYSDRVIVKVRRMKKWIALKRKNLKRKEKE